MNGSLGDFDRRLLAAVQRAVPLVPRPYQQLAADLGSTTDEVIMRLAALTAPEGVIREIAGIFDVAALGYASTLVAARLAPDGLDEAGRSASQHPGVSHCYARDGELNLWFTLVVPPDSTLGLAATVELLGRRIGAQRVLSLPALRRYKLSVRFDMAGEGDASGASPDFAGGVGPACVSAAPARPPAPEQIRAIRAMQTPLPAVREPFAVLAGPAGLAAEDLLVHAADFLATGWMRRYAAVLRHRRVGAAVNVLVAWAVPAGQADAFAARACPFKAVSHCYLRAAGEGWPYHLYTMIHGRSDEEVAAVTDAIRTAAGAPLHIALATTAEYKKERVKLFSPEFAHWEAAARR